MTDTADDTGDQATRRLAAKRANERIKLLIVSVNTVALTMFGATLVIPVVSGSRQDVPVTWILVAIGLHVMAQALFQFLRNED